MTQHLDDIRSHDRLPAAANASRDVERRSPLLVLGVHSRATFDQRRDDARARLAGGDVQRRLAVAVSGVDVDAVFDGELNRRDLVGVRHRERTPEPS